MQQVLLRPQMFVYVCVIYALTFESLLYETKTEPEDNQQTTKTINKFRYQWLHTNTH